jgi:hypothetical protein
MDFLDSLQLPEWLTTFNLDYVVIAFVAFSLIRSLFKNYRSLLRGFLWFTIPFALVLGTLFLDVANLPFLQSAIDLSGQTWIGEINTTIVGFVMGNYTTLVAPLTAALPFGLSALFAVDAWVYFTLILLTVGLVSLIFTLLGNALDRPKAVKNEDDHIKSHSATPLRSFIVALLRNAVAVYIFYLFIQLGNSVFALDLSSSQYLVPTLSEYDPILAQLIAVVTAALGA